LENLKRKIDAGAGRAITQFFFDTDVFLRYRDRCSAAGIHVNIVPRNTSHYAFSAAAAVRRSLRCLSARMAATAASTGWTMMRKHGRMIAAHVAIEQVHRLQEHGVEEFHFYTLNRAELTYAICHAMGLRPRVAEESRVA